MEASQVIAVLAVVTPLLLTMLAGLGWLYRSERERRVAAEDKLDEHKKRVYLKLVGVFMDIFNGVKTGKPVSDKVLATKMSEINADLLIYGSDDVVFAYQGFLKSARASQADLRRFGDLFAAVRRDMGHAKTKIGRDEVLRQFINDYDDPEVQRRLRGEVESVVANDEAST